MSLSSLMYIESIGDVIVYYCMIFIDSTSDIFSEDSFVYRSFFFRLSLEENCRFSEPFFSCIF
nr:MAG TPA: hypothetical protein [Caudoviricetes sp.]